MDFKRDDSNPRNVLDRLIAERGDDYSGLSRLIGKNAAYIQQFIKRGTPRRLAEDDRATLARYFGVDEAMFGAPVSSRRDATGYIPVPQLAVGASAGPGALAHDERTGGRIAFDQDWLRRNGLRPAELSIIAVDGDSMLPTLANGDDIMVDRNDGAQRLRDGIYVIRIDDALLVKRLARGPGSVSVISDNPAFPSWDAVPPADLDIIGRVVWTGRRLS